MQDLKNYLKDRKKYLEQIIDADPSEDCISTLGQLHELNHIILWMEEQEDADETPKDAHKTYADGVKDAYNDILHMIYADGCDADAIRKALENTMEATPCND